MVTVEIKECRNAYCEIDALELELESFYSITTFIRAMTSLLQIRQVAHLMEHYMQPARTKPHAKGAHNPVGPRRGNVRVKKKIKGFSWPPKAVHENVFI